MPIAGLSLTLNQDKALVSDSVAALSKRPEIFLGKWQSQYMAAVIDTPNSRDSRDLHRWIESLPGVDFVDVVYVGFDEEAPASANLSPQLA